MLPSSDRTAHRVVIVGGGIAALEALVALRRQAPSAGHVTVVAPDGRFAYRALGVQEPFGRGAGRGYDLGALVRGLGARLVRDALELVDGEARQIGLRSRACLPYDTLIIASGARPYPAYAHGVSFEREREADAFDEVLVDLDAQLVSRLAVVVPAPAGWTLPAYELALAVAVYGRQPHGRDVAVTLVTPEAQPLAAFGSTASRAVAQLLADAGVELIAGSDAVVMSDGALIARGRWVTADRIVALPRLAGPRPRGVPCDADGFIPVDAHGRVPGMGGVYAAGDATAATVKQGGLAAQQADTIVAHLLWRLGVGPQPRPVAPVLRGVLATPRGTLHLQAELGPGRAGEGSIASWVPLWPAPGRVASRWLGAYLDGGREARAPFAAATRPR
jgi:sulfide:quinone oxidoreductase